MPLRTKCGVSSSFYVYSIPAFFTVNVAMASIRGEDKQSYDSRPTCLNFCLTAPIFSGSKPCSTMLLTRAAGYGSYQPSLSLSSA